MRAIKLICGLSLCLSLQAGNSAQPGVQLFEQGQYTQALRQLEPVARSGDETARVYLALTQAAVNKCNDALPVLARESLSHNVRLERLAAITATRCYAATGHMAEAITTAERLKQRFPADADILYLAAETEMKAFNDTTYAMFQHTPSSYRVHELSARIFEVQNRFGDAASEYRKAIELSPTAPDLHYRLGRAILLASHSPEAMQEAAASFAAELKISPEDSASEFQLGQIAQAQAQNAQAERRFARALEVSPGFVPAMVGLAGCYANDHDTAHAIVLLTRAVQLEPANEPAHYALLTVYRNAGEMDKARAEKAELDRLRKPPEGEFSEFLKKLGDSKPQQ